MHAVESRAQGFEPSSGFGVQRAFGVAYAVGAALLLVLAWMPINASIHRFLYEDFFYYLTAAQNVLGDHVLTLDGVERTNGFHPLWMVLSVFVRAIVDHDATIHVMLTIAALLHAAQSYLVFRLVDASGGGRISAHAAAAFWLLNYRVIACNLCGLETPLAIFMLLATWLFLLRHAHPHVRTWPVQLGGLLALCALSRFDLLLFDLIVLAAIVCLPRFGQTLRARVLSATVAASVLLFGMLPWFAWSFEQSATLLPNSRAAIALLSGRQLGLHAGLAENLSVLRERVFSAVWWFADTANLLGLSPWVRPRSSIVSFAALAALLLLSAALLVRARSQVGAGVRALLLVYAWLHLAYYAAGFMLLVRYMLPFCVVVIVIAFAVAGRWRERGSGRVRRACTLAYALLTANAAYSGVEAWRQHQGATRTHEAHRDFLAMALWVRAHVPPAARIGAWNSGIMSYFSAHRVTNLDGVMNDQALSAIEHHTLESYIGRRELDFIVDEESQVNALMTDYGGDPDWRNQLELVHRIGGVVLLARHDTMRREISAK
jgi:hypothetical protein